MMRFRNACVVSLAAIAIMAGSPSQARHDGWEVFDRSRLGYRIELPVADFAIVEEAPGRLTLEERGGAARIVTYAGERPAGSSLSDIRQALESAEWIRDVTYRAGGRSWFVSSGHYRPQATGGEELIFYTKVMLNRDRTEFSGFEITYPRSRRHEFDALVARLEKSLRPPR